MRVLDRRDVREEISDLSLERQFDKGIDTQGRESVLKKWSYSSSMGRQVDSKGKQIEEEEGRSVGGVYSPAGCFPLLTSLPDLIQTESKLK